MFKQLLTDKSAEVIAHRIAQWKIKAILVKQQIRRDAWYDFIKIIDPFENKFIDVLVSLFKRQEVEVLANMKRTPKAYIKQDDTAIIDAWLFGKRAWQEMFGNETSPIIKGIFIANGTRELAKLPGVAVSFDVNTPRAIEYMRVTTYQYSNEVLNTISESLRSELATGLELGEGIPKLSKRVRTVYNGYTEIKDDMPPWKARQIARTQTTGAANFGTKEAYKQSEVVEEKEWLATLDARVRDAHAILDGEVVGLDDKFSNGLEYPGDSANAVDASQVVNCRCTMMPVLMKE